MFLSEETVGWVTVNTMTYDNYGNILTKNGVAYAYGDSTWKDLLTAVGGQSISYDAQGNPVSYLGHTLTWEKGRQLKSFDDNTYTYNANGIRTSKTINGVKHTYTLDGTKILKEEWAGNVLIPLYDNEDVVCGIIYNGTPYYFEKNLQGDVISIVDAACNLVARYTYDAWGVCTGIVDANDTDLTGNTSHIANINPFRYRGYYFDNDINLYYLQSRYYNPNIGRFVNLDELVYLGFGGTIITYNLFTYCENNSVNFIDNFGHAPSSSTLTKMHNSVVDSAQHFLDSIFVFSDTEVRTCNKYGKYNGRMDIYSGIYNRVWEVKRNNKAGITAGYNQLQRYTSSYVYSLYHSWLFSCKVTPRMGNRNVYGCTIVSEYLVVYHSHPKTSALIVYDYMTLKKAAELLFDFVVEASTAAVAALAKLNKKTKEKVNSLLEKLKKVANKAGKTVEIIIKGIVEFLKKAGFALLLIVAILILLYMGIAVAA